VDLETLRYREDGDVATITLARPDRGNRINVAFLKDFEKVCHHLEDASPCRVVVIRADGPDFCLGIDFLDFDPKAAMDIHGFAKWEKLVVLLERLPKVTVAALNGRVEGGGLQLALVCDQRVAHSNATLCLPEVHLGFLPGMATFRIAKYVGLGRARRMMLTAERIPAAQAERIGLVDRLCDDLDAGIAAAIAAFGPTYVVAVEMARRLLDESFAETYEDAVGNFLAAQHRCVAQTAFLDTLKRERKGG
jgi:enoyl-CoA hydratase/carnithine racemase